MGSQLINLCLIPDHSGCDIFALQLQGLGDHKLYFSTARTGFRSPVALWMLVLLSRTAPDRGIINDLKEKGHHLV